MTTVSLKSLTKRYPGTAAPALDDLSLNVENGELLALLGPSGCGKTTTMKMIAGLLSPTGGDIQFDGQSILHQRAEHRGVVMVFQNHLLFPYMSVADNVGFGLKMRKRPPPEIAQQVDRMLDLVKLPGLGNRRPADLSGGQQQRVALARALIVHPKVLLLDEPLSNLDAHLRLEMRDLIRSLQQDMGITTLFVTHDQEEAVVLADRVALILNGRLQQVARPDVFYTRPASRAVATFFGGQNFLPGRASGGLFDGPLGPLKLPHDAPQGPGVLTFRPENVQIHPEPVPNRPNTLTATLDQAIYLGTQTRLRLSIGDTRIEAVTHPATAQALAPARAVTLSLPPDTLWMLPERR